MQRRQEPTSNEEPKIAWSCVCGTTIFKLENDEQLTCHACESRYPEYHHLEVDHVRCPWCNTSISGGRLEMDKVGVGDDRQFRHVGEADCPECEFYYRNFSW